MRILYSDFRKNLNDIIDQYADNGVFIIIDKTVHSLMAAELADKIASWRKCAVFPVEAVESSKSIDSAIKIWQWLEENGGANRKSLIINIGGGVVTDLGGFAASTFKRGCSFVNVPTTLLAMVDAAIGGKTGVNFCGLKNEIGTFADPYRVLINTDFLATLPVADLYDGYAEMLKYGFISDKSLLRDTYCIDLQNVNCCDIIRIIKEDIKIKQHLARVDRYDTNERRALNFGHTFAHALEAFCAANKHPLTHGTAVAWGMVCELYLSVLQFGFPKDELSRLHYFVKDNYNHIPLSCSDFDKIYGFMTRDKKNISNAVNFTLLRDVGVFLCNQSASKTDIYEALEYVF